MVGKLPSLQHPGEAVKDCQVGAFLFAARPVFGPETLPGQHGDGLAVATHRHCGDVHRTVRTDVDGALNGLIGLERLDDQRPSTGFEHLADEVSPVEGGSGSGSHMAQQYQRPIRPCRFAGVEQQVGEREVGQ